VAAAELRVNDMNRKKSTNGPRKMLVLKPSRGVNATLAHNRRPKMVPLDQLRLLGNQRPADRLADAMMHARV